MHERGILRNKTTILQQGEGQIRNIQWKSQFIVWGSDLSVRIYDVDERAVITLIRRDHDIR